MNKKVKLFKLEINYEAIKNFISLNDDYFKRNMTVKNVTDL